MVLFFWDDCLEPEWSVQSKSFLCEPLHGPHGGSSHAICASSSLVKMVCHKKSTKSLRVKLGLLCEPERQFVD